MADWPPEMMAATILSVTVFTALLERGVGLATSVISTTIPAVIVAVGGYAFRTRIERARKQREDKAAHILVHAASPGWEATRAQNDTISLPDLLSPRFREEPLPRDFIPFPKNHAWALLLEEDEAVRRAEARYHETRTHFNEEVAGIGALLEPELMLLTSAFVDEAAYGAERRRAAATQVLHDAATLLERGPDFLRGPQLRDDVLLLDSMYTLVEGDKESLERIRTGMLTLAGTPELANHAASLKRKLEDFKNAKKVLELELEKVVLAKGPRSRH